MSFDFPEMPEYEYQGADHTSSVFDRELHRFLDTGDTSYPRIMFCGVDHRSFLRGFLRAEHKIIRQSWKSYDRVHSTVLLEMGSRVHGVACAAITRAIEFWASDAKSLLMSTGTAEFPGVDGIQRPDAAWEPQILPLSTGLPGPSLVVEVRGTETQAELMNNIQFWLTDCETKVPVVLSLGVSPDYSLKIQRWALDSTGQLIATEQLDVQRVNGAPLITGEFQIDFREVFLRPKLRGEKDFVFDHTVITGLTQRIWCALAQDEAQAA